MLLRFCLRSDLPDPTGKAGVSSSGEAKRNVKVPEPDKTNYPSFRGQDSRGIAGGSGYSTEWNGTEGKNIEWKTEIPKSGQSSPAIWDDKIFLTGAEGKECEVYCIDKKTGDLLWTGHVSNIPGEPDVSPETDHDTGLAASTVAVNDEVVCAVFANGNLACFDHDGKLLWSKNIGLPENVYGYSSSLIMYEDLLLVQFDSNEKISLMGFESETGELKWETIRQGRPVWSSPVIGIFWGETTDYNKRKSKCD